MDNLVKAAQVIGLPLEVGNGVMGKVVQRPEQGEEGGLAGAVLAHKEGERRQTGRLLLPKAAEILDGYGVHGGSREAGAEGHYRVWRLRCKLGAREAGNSGELADGDGRKAWPYLPVPPPPLLALSVWKR